MNSSSRDSYTFFTLADFNFYETDLIILSSPLGVCSIGLLYSGEILLGL